MKRLRRAGAGGVVSLHQHLRAARRRDGDPARRRLLERRAVLDRRERRRVHASADVVREFDRVLVRSTGMIHVVASGAGNLAAS